ncbi:MAG TPA: hypothetical protein VII72_18905 [Myxococcota bacterium]|jgi:hypothetical protein
MSRNEKLLTPIPLDWSRLLGFDQVTHTDANQPAALRDARLTKVGAKPCQIRNPALGDEPSLPPRRR